MENRAQNEPNSQGSPLRRRKVSWENRENLHQEEQQGNEYPHARHNAHGSALLYHPEGQAGSEPAEGRSHRTDFRDRYQERIAEQDSCQRRSRYAEDRYEGCKKFFVDFAKARRNSPPAAKREEQPA